MRAEQKKLITLAGSALLAFAASSFPEGTVNNLQDYLGPQFRSARKAASIETTSSGTSAADIIHHWNQIAVDASGLDHTPVASGDTRIFGEQLGPARSSRAMAIVHIAMFDSVNGIMGGYKSYTNVTGSRGASMTAAIAQAARDTLVALFPSQQATFDQALASELNSVPGGGAKTDGIDLGRRAAAAILALRANDGSQQAEPRLGLQFFTSNDPGKWRQDPISQSPIALGAYWNQVTPFVLQSAAQFRAPTPPALTSLEYTTAFTEVKLIGGDGIVTPTIRTADQTETGIYWAYDGTPSLCAPPRLYNQITMHIAEQMGTTANPLELARLLALVNVAMADAGIAVWESKFYYQFWRPITGIREADPGSGPSGAGDGNPATIGDPDFHPLGAPASNLTGPNFTPPFPAYPSGHAGFGGALFETLRRYYGRDDIAFTFTSDEFNGTTVDNTGAVRPLKPRSFSSLSQAEEENGQSRIYLGIHWAFDKTEGIAQGRKVADYVYANAFTVAPCQLVNISTRTKVLTDDRVLIGGFIITGSESKKVALRAIGPSLAASGLSGVLADPVLELHDATGSVIAINDDWQTDAGAAELAANGIAPGDDRESATIQTLSPGAYTAVVSGKDNTTGVALVELYDLDQGANSVLANISSRGFIDTGDNALIGGFILGRGLGNGTVVVRAIGPSLSAFNVANPVQDPTLELVNASGTTIASNDNWQTDPGAAQIQSNNLAPSDTRESATLQSLAPGNYSAIVRSNDNTTGVGLVEVYNLPNP